MFNLLDDSQFVALGSADKAQRKQRDNNPVVGTAIAFTADDIANSPVIKYVRDNYEHSCDYTGSWRDLYVASK